MARLCDTSGIPPRLSDVFATLRQARGRRAFIMPMSPDYIELPLRLFRRADVWHRIGGNLRVDPGKLIAAGWQPAHDTNAGLVALIDAASRSRNIMPPITPTPKT